MRDIEFRGRYHLIETDERIWIYGCNVWGEIVDENDENWRVDESTIGQWTGLKDDNGVKIYEGDVVEAFYFKDYYSGVVKYDDELGGFYIWFPEQKVTLPVYASHETQKVIGNIFDNPEFDKQFGEVYRSKE